MESASTLPQVLSILHRRQRWIEGSRVYLDTLLCCLICLCGLLVWHRFFSPLPTLPWISIGIGVGGGLVASLWLLWRKPVPLTLLIQADRQLHLQERLSTAYEIAEKEEHPFRTTLLSEVTRVAPHVDPRQVFPWKLSRRFWGIPLLVLGCIGLVFVELPVLETLSMHTSAVEPQVRAEFTKLEKFAQRLEQQAYKERLEKSRNLARRMQQLEASLQVQDPPRRQAVTRVSSLIDYVRNLQEELQKESLLSDLEIQQVREVFVARENLTQELQQILQMLARGEFRLGDLGTAERSLEQLIEMLGKEGGALSKELQEALKNLRAGDVKGAQEILHTVLRQQKFAEDHENLRKAEEALRESARALGGDPAESIPSVSDLDDLEGGDADRPTGRQANRGEMGEGTLADEGLEGLDYEGGPRVSRQPGTASGADPEGSPEQMEEPSSSQLAQKIESQNTGEGEIHRVYIKALPLKSSSALPLEEVIVNYQHQVEEIMLKEEVPAQYRHYIRNYFLAIGVMRGNDEQGQGRTEEF